MSTRLSTRDSERDADAAGQGEPSHWHWPRRLNTTRWDIVLAARRGDEIGRDALGELYRIYWYPIYSLIAARRSPEQARELTQAFFAERLVLAQDLSRFQPDKCRRFRSWLFAAVDSFLKTRWHFERRQCRDVRKTDALDFDAAEERFLQEPPDDPEHRYNRAWALWLLRVVLERLRSTYCASDARVARFDVIKAHLLDDAEHGDRVAASAALGMTPNAMKQLVHRQRQRFMALLREEVSSLVRDDAEIEPELAFLCEALRGARSGVAAP